MSAKEASHANIYWNHADPRDPFVASILNFSKEAIMQSDVNCNYSETNYMGTNECLYRISRNVSYNLSRLHYRQAWIVSAGDRFSKAVAADTSFGTFGYYHYAFNELHFDVYEIYNDAPIQH